jgi:hypothetical protein
MAITLVTITNSKIKLAHLFTIFISLCVYSCFSGCKGLHRVLRRGVGETTIPLHSCFVSIARRMGERRRFGGEVAALYGKSAATLRKKWRHLKKGAPKLLFWYTL